MPLTVCSSCILSISFHQKYHNQKHHRDKISFCDTWAAFRPILGSTTWTLPEDFDSVCRCVVNPAGRHRSERDRNGGGCIRNSLQLNLSTLKIFQGFSDLTRSTEAGTARLLVRAPSQQQQQNLKSLERQCFLKDVARVSFTKSEASGRHIRMASEKGLWVSLLRPRRVPQRQF